MLALAECENLTCQGCGGWLPETTAGENDERYAPPEPIRCHSCDAQQGAQERHAEHSYRPGAVRWTRPELKARR